MYLDFYPFEKYGNLFNMNENSDTSIEESICQYVQS